MNVCSLQGTASASSGLGFLREDAWQLNYGQLQVLQQWADQLGPLPQSGAQRLRDCRVYQLMEEAVASCSSDEELLTVRQRISSQIEQRLFEIERQHWERQEEESDDGRFLIARSIRQQLQGRRLHEVESLHLAVSGEDRWGIKSCRSPP